MKRFLDTLYGRISVAYLLLLLLFCTLSIVATLQSARRFTYESDQNLNRDLAAIFYDRIRPELENDLNTEALKEAFTSFMQVNPRVDIYLLDGEGRILASSVPSEDLQLQRVDIAPIARFAGGEPLPLLGADPRSLNQRKIFSAEPVDLASETGYVYVVLLSKLYDSVASLLRDDFILRTVAANLALVFLFTGIAGLLVFAFVTRSFRRITRTVKSFEEGRLDRRVQPVGTGELGSLAKTLNEMAEKVQQQVDVLQERDAFRREFLANVSHDLRSPITSIRGYVETAIIKNGTLSEQERLDHLTVVYDETKRLDHLIVQLLQLARLEARSVQRNDEPFAPGELIQDVVLKFRARTDRQDIELCAELPTDLPLVRADIGMIERVLSNLVENSVEHTPEGGRVVIEGSQVDGGVLITVQDTGTGISEEDLPRATERFYKGARKRAAGVGTGLGLAIAERIVELHDSSLSIDSRLGEGTTVSFELPLE